MKDIAAYLSNPDVYFVKPFILTPVTEIDQLALFSMIIPDDGNSISAFSCDLDNAAQHSPVKCRVDLFMDTNTADEMAVSISHRTFPQHALRH